MSSAQRVAVVTGSNKGIGFAIVVELCKKFDGIVYLTGRNSDLGKKAVANLKKIGLTPQFQQLDIDDVPSIEAFAKYIKETHGGLDVLVNNAAIAYTHSSTVPFAEQTENTIRVNYFGTLNVCKALFPLLRPQSRVVTVSSFVAMLDGVPGRKLRDNFVYEDLTEDELSKLMEDFVESTKAGNYKEKGWPSSAYSISKVAVTALTVIQQKAFDKDPREDIIINCINPGFVDTDMSSHKGSSTPEQGAAPAVYAALLPPNVTSPKGKLIWDDKSVAQWAPVPLPKRN